jgi:ComF family protein
VPSSRQKYNQRGFNPAERIAKHLSKYSGRSYKKLLYKNKATVAMKNLNRMQRKLTVKNTFDLVHKDLSFKKILLIDDVFTTGATINECSKVLYENYLCEIITVTVYVGHRK